MLNSKMEHDFLELIEPTPKLESKKCQLGASLLSFFLNYFTIIISLISWYMYDYFIAGATLLITFLLIGIIRSKLRNDVIPANQREFHYTDKAIASWYFSKRIC
jgi:hypothetical protein